jgi:purine-binding chemotaxis protein CheW
MPRAIRSRASTPRGNDPMNRILDAETGDIDWADFRGRIARAFDVSDDRGQGAQRKTRAILEERARRLALAPAAAAQQQDALSVLPFRLGREQYGLETRFAREVIRLTEFTTIPAAPDFLIGIANLRGEILPVFDLMRFFGFASSGLMDRSRVIVVGIAEAEFGIIADTVQEVAALSAEPFVADPVFTGARGGECIQGVTPDAMIVLDGAALIRDPRLFIGSPANAAP